MLALLLIVLTWFILQGYKAVKIPWQLITLAHELEGNQRDTKRNRKGTIGIQPAYQRGTPGVPTGYQTEPRNFR